MTADQFAGWMEARGWGVRETARHLRVDPASVSKWARGLAPLPTYIAAHIDTLNRLEEKR